MRYMKKLKISDMPKWEDAKQELLKDPEFKKAYDKLTPKYALIEAMITARSKKDLTQKQLAVKLKTKQSAIARLESGRSNPTYNFLQKIAKATDTTLEIRFV